MAVPAIDSQPAHVVLVAEGDRLVPRHFRQRHVLRILDPPIDLPQYAGDDYRAGDAPAGNRVGVPRKELSHSVRAKSNADPRYPERVTSKNFRQSSEPKSSVVFRRG